MASVRAVGDPRAAVSVSSTSAPPMGSGQVWLFGRGVDLAVFLGSALVSVAFVAAAPLLGVRDDFPVWAWLLFVVCVDVGHVWSTLFRVYLDPEEVRRRLALFVGAPLLAYTAGFVAYQQSAGTFWRLFAYAALFHFIRQQYGWAALYNRKARSSKLDFRLDGLAIYAATVGPALWWHANLPRPFWWFVPNDFFGLPQWVGTVSLAAHWGVLGAWVLRQVWRAAKERHVAVGKVALVLATWIAWYGGIVLAQSDYAFTVMNVVLHGVPYFVLLFHYAKGRDAEGGYGGFGRVLRLGAPGFVAFLVALAFVEELFWDKLVWHEHAMVFGADQLTLTPELLAFVVPLLALPQATHYVLDAFIWKAGKDRALLVRLGWAKPDGSAEQQRPAKVDNAEPTWL